MKFNEIKNGLIKAEYYPSQEIVYAVSAAVNQNIPLIIEGDPGVGKTALAKATAKMLGLPLLRVQFYEGLTADKILYDYNYQKQLLTIEAIKSALEDHLKGKSIQEAIDIAKDINFYGPEFLIERPILQALDGKQRCVLLLDEIDKSSEEIEYTLLEALDEYSITIPQYGTVTCPDDKKPVIFLTSNRYRQLSDALRRRCGYLYIEQKTQKELCEILKMHAKADPGIIKGVAACLAEIRKLNTKQTPSIAEGITWAEYLQQMVNQGEDIDVRETVGIIAKTKDDREIIVSSDALEKVGQAVSNAVPEFAPEEFAPEKKPKKYTSAARTASARRFINPERQDGSTAEDLEALLNSDADSSKPRYARARKNPDVVIDPNLKAAEKSPVGVPGDLPSDEEISDFLKRVNGGGDFDE